MPQCPTMRQCTKAMCHAMQAPLEAAAFQPEERTRLETAALVGREGRGRAKGVQGVKGVKGVKALQGLQGELQGLQMLQGVLYAERVAHAHEPNNNNTQAAARPPQRTAEPEAQVVAPTFYPLTPAEEQGGSVGAESQARCARLVEALQGAAVEAQQEGQQKAQQEGQQKAQQEGQQKEQQQAKQAMAADAAILWAAGRVREVASREAVLSATQADCHHPQTAESPSRWLRRGRWLSTDAYTYRCRWPGHSRPRLVPE